MTSPRHLQGLVADLQDAKILSVDATVSDVVRTASRSAALAEILQRPDGTVEPDWYVIGGSGYAIVCKS